jgi:hypothetical protein
LAAAAGDVRGLRGFGEEALVAGLQGEKEAVFDFVDAPAKLSAGKLEGSLLGFDEEAFEKKSALGERRVDQSAPVKEEQVEGDEAHGNQRRGEEIDLFAAETLLEFGERDRAAIAPSDDLAVEDEITGDAADWIEKLREFSDAV